jgi:hypothetical protein
MTRSRFMKTLLTATACGGLVWGQSANPTPPPLESRIGKVITVQEANRPAEKCVILKVWHSPDGKPVMQAQGVQSGAMMTIVEQPNATVPAEHFRVFHWGADGQPPQGCPLPPEMAASKKPAKETVKETVATEKKEAKETEKKEVKEVVAATKSTPSSHAMKQESQTAKADGQHAKAAESTVAKEPAKTPAKAAEPEKIVVKAAEPEKTVVKAAEKPTKSTVIAKTPEPEKTTTKTTEKVEKLLPATDKKVAAVVYEPVKAPEKPAKPVTSDNKVVTAVHEPAKVSEKTAKPVMNDNKVVTAAAKEPVKVVEKPAKPVASEHLTAAPVQDSDHVVAKPQRLQPMNGVPGQVEHLTGTSPSRVPGQTDHLIGTSPYGSANSAEAGQGAAEHHQASPYRNEGTGASSIAPSAVSRSASPPATTGDHVTRQLPKPAENIVPPAAPKEPVTSRNQEPERVVKAPSTKVVKSSDASQSDTQGLADHQIIVLTKADGSPMKCAVLSESVRADGVRLTKVKVLETGEVVTINEEALQPPSVVKASPAPRERVRPSAPPSIVDSGKPSYMQPSASMPASPPADMPAPKPSLAQRIRDRLHGSDRDSVETPMETAASKNADNTKSSEKNQSAKKDLVKPEDRNASFKRDETLSGDKSANLKKDEAKPADKAVTAKLETPKPAEKVDWHKSWEAEVNPKAAATVAKSENDLPVRPELNLRPDKAMNLEPAKKVESLPPVVDMKPAEKHEDAPKVVAHVPPMESPLAAKKVEPSPARTSVPEIVAPALPLPAPEPPKVSAAPSMPEPPAPEAPKIALAPPTAEVKPPEPKMDLRPVMNMTPPIMPERKMEDKPMVAELPTPVTTRTPAIGLKRPDNMPQEPAGLAFASSQKEGTAPVSEMPHAALPKAGMAEVGQLKPKPPMIDPEVRKAQAIKYGAVLMELLQNSGVPSEREMAAIQLRTADSSQVPMAAQALLNAAKDDATPLVRIAAMQSLMAMKIHTPEVKAMLEMAVSDPDPRVRDEAKLSLSLMNKPPEVRPASYRR